MASPSSQEHTTGVTRAEAVAVPPTLRSLSNRQRQAAIEHERESSPRHVGQDESIRELLATANTRQDTFQEIRESSFAAPSVRDDRKCDYPLQPIPRIASGRRSSSSRRGSHVALQPPVETPRGEVEAKVAVSSEVEYLVWRRDLQAHVAHVLTELRLRPLDLQVFLASHFPKTERGEGEEDSSDDDDQATASEKTAAVTQPSTSIYDISPVQLQRHVRKFLSVQGVYKRLMEIGTQLGEALYFRLRSMLLKSVTHGVLDRASNVVRLESMFKLELRRHVTIETLRDAVEAKQAQYQKTKQQQRLSRSKRRAATKDGQSAESGSTTGHRPHHGGEEDGVLVSGTVSSTQDFKLQALERVLDNARQRSGASPISRDVAVVVVVPPRSGHDPLEEHLHERITSALYSKNRDNFPFWKDPPENDLSREETAKVLRVVVSVLLALPIFRTLSVDQLLEMARGTRWRIAGQGHAVAVKNQVVDQLLIVMEGRVTKESIVASATESVQAQGQQPQQHQRAADKENPLEAGRECLGEMGLLSKNEFWPSTLRVVSSQAKLLVLSRDAFDAALLKIFGGLKRQSQSSVNGMKRPTSSPAAARLLPQRSTSGGVVSVPRPVTAARARDQAVAKFRQFRDEQLARGDETMSGGNGSVHDQEEPTNVTSRRTPRDRMERPMGTSRVYQHYPSFPAASSSSSSTTTSSAGSHLLRLKCIQPIAFGMKSVEEVIHDEWAPAFPETGTLVDYLATAESNFLFEKRNVLMKANLRAVCTNLPFQGGEDRGGARSADREISTSDLQGGDAVSVQAAFAEPVSPTNAAAVAGNSSAPMNTPPVILATGEGDSMTLGQFTEARKRVFGKHGSSFKGAASPSMRNLLASSATSATLAKTGHAPFTNSSFVPEASFTNDLRLKSRMELNEKEEDDEEDGDGDDAEMEQILEEQAQNRRKSSVVLRPVSRPEVDEDDDSGGGSSIASDANALSPIDVDSPTRARKSALDSLVQSMASPSKKQSIVDQEAARRIILQKHLYAANQGPPSSSSRRKSSVVTAASAVPGGGTEDASTTGSHAPLPLRVDLQRRMEVVLAALQMKPKTKLDLVLKYTHADFFDRFPDAVVLWEQALQYIQKREKALEALRQFELVASDPRRHFRSLSTHRLTEQKERDSLFYQLNYASDLCRESLEELEKRCGDVVYFESRVYRDKMKKDYTELLFDVEQERLRMIYKGVHPAATPTTSSSSHAAGRASPQPLQVTVSGSGRSSSSSAARYALTTPRESIYTSVVTREQQDAREEQERQRAAQAEAAVNQKPSHNLSARVKMHRQAQLDATTRAARAGPTTTPREQQPTQATANQRETQVVLRAASGVEPVVSSITSTVGRLPTAHGKMDALKNAIESALGRR